MRKTFFLISSILFVSVVYGQTFEFGKVTLEELKMQKYSLDTAASAVILFDKGECSLSDQLEVVYKNHIRIKFFTKSSIEDWATKTTYLIRSEEGISKIKASTYNLENGKIVESKMEDISIFRTRYDKKTDQVKFTLPNVKEGSVIEYSYTFRTSASLLPDWQFQYQLPSMHSEYQTYIPKTFTFRSEMKGFLNVTEHITKNEGASEKWIMKNIPAFKEEPFTANTDDYVSRISFHISEVFVPGRPIIKFGTTWRNIVRDLIEDSDFGGQIKGSGFLKPIVTEITTGLTEDEQKMKAIYDYVKSKVEWNKFIDKIPDHTFKKVLEDKKGSSSEINLLIVSMLQKAELLAYPVLISTRKHGSINLFYPQFSELNDVICMVKIGEKEILLDATDRGLPMNALPERCLNGEGLVVSKDDIHWVPLTSVRSRRVINADFKVNDIGEISGKLVINREGLDASDMRDNYKELGKEKYLKDFLTGKTWEVSNSNFESLEDPSHPAKETHEILINDHTQVAGDIIYLNPYLTGRIEENLFKSEERLYPIDYSTTLDRIYMAKIRIPDGFTVEELPKPKIILLPDNSGKFVYSLSQIGNTINFVSQFVINKSVFQPDEYKNLREFYDHVVAKQAEQIVLKKK